MNMVPFSTAIAASAILSTFRAALLSTALTKKKQNKCNSADHTKLSNQCRGIFKKFVLHSEKLSNRKEKREK